MRETIRYSEAFKLQVVREIETGKYGNCNAASEAYGIRVARPSGTGFACTVNRIYWERWFAWKQPMNVMS